MKMDHCMEQTSQSSSPQIITMETLVPAGGARVQASSAAVDFGRRLLLAARAGDTPAVRALMAKGAPFTTDWLGTSPLHLAAANDHAETVGVLLRAGVSRDARTKVERTPLHLAAYAGHAAVAAALLAHGANVHCRDMLGMTPLHWAVQRGHARVVALLLRHGADPSARSKFLKTPLSLATSAARLDLARLMDDALKEREAAHSVTALFTDQMGAEEAPAPPAAAAASTVAEVEVEAPRATRAQEPRQRAPAPPPPDAPAPRPRPAHTPAPAPAAQQAGGGAGERGAARLLRQHGITLLPADDGGTVLSALQSGRTVVLSDAGKLMLKESGLPAGGGGGVVLTATPVKSPPAPGVKIFTLNNTNKLVALGRAGRPAPHHHNHRLQQVKCAPRRGTVALPAPAAPAIPAPAAPRPAVKIIMNRANFTKLIATATKASAAPAPPPPSAPQESGERVSEAARAGGAEEAGTEGAEEAEGGEAESVVCVPEEFVRSSSPQYLRAQLLCAHAALAQLRAELRTARATIATLQHQPQQPPP